MDVTAETLYEAAALALSIFRQSEWADVIGSNTELVVAVNPARGSGADVLRLPVRLLSGVRRGNPLRTSLAIL